MRGFDFLFAAVLLAFGLWMLARRRAWARAVWFLDPLGRSAQVVVGVLGVLAVIAGVWLLVQGLVVD